MLKPKSTFGMVLSSLLGRDPSTDKHVRTDFIKRLARMGLVRSRQGPCFSSSCGVVFGALWTANAKHQPNVVSLFARLFSALRSCFFRVGRRFLFAVVFSPCEFFFRVGRDFLFVVVFVVRRCFFGQEECVYLQYLN